MKDPLNNGAFGKRHSPTPSEGGQYVLRPMLENIPLAHDDSPINASITCVEYWNDNLYIGTSTSEVLHLVALPADPTNPSAGSSYILASRSQPSGHGAAPSSTRPSGVQQIVILPGPSKACILCNGIVSFYSLPELSPVFPNREPTGVQWIGGIDENEERQNPEGPVLMIANSRRILLVRVGDKLKPIKNNIEYPGCLKSCRRDTIACVADDRGYTLLELEHQQKIPLFPISSFVEADTEQTTNELVSKAASVTRGAPGTSTHNRSSSLGILVDNVTAQRSNFSLQTGKPPDVHAAESDSSQYLQTDTEPANRSSTRLRSSTETLKGGASQGSTSKAGSSHLRPHILSPVPTEFMLVTGTIESDPGVGMFVNLDGDAVRGTIEFSSFPASVIADSFEPAENSAGSESSQTQYVIALLEKSMNGNSVQGLEIQKVPNENDGDSEGRSWLPLPDPSDFDTSGLFQTLDAHTYFFNDVVDRLQLARLKPPDTTRGSIHLTADADPRTKSSIEQVEQETALFETHSDANLGMPSPDADARRSVEEAKIASRFGSASTRAIVWQNDNLWQILQNPLLLRLEADLLLATVSKEDTSPPADLNIEIVMAVLDSIREIEARNELEFLTLNYIRQKASLLLFRHLQTFLESGANIGLSINSVESALHQSGLDPRVILLLVPALASEVLQGGQGIWLHQGVREIAIALEPRLTTFEQCPLEFWLMMRHYLTVWQDKRGYGSISDEKQVFDSVDAALLHLLLYLDRALPSGSGLRTSVRAKLDNLVDHWRADFDRAIVLLESYHRLFVLSRLYQSRKLSRNVLGTWKRIVEGDEDFDYDSNAEAVLLQIRRYLTVIRDANLVREYGLWLANRDPGLAVQMFADDTSRVKFAPQETVAMLKEHAPAAVQQYLEYLVFVKNHDMYADDLIGYYLDSVISVLETSEAARESLRQSYSTYRKLAPPKPTYLNFITDNASAEPWWQSRLRLLQLLGSAGYAQSAPSGKGLSYSVPLVLDRLAPFSSALVSESIILDARQGRHEEALQLLIHGLGDYDTAIRYCYFGGPSPTSSETMDATLLPARQVQRQLFGHLFHEFLRMSDKEESIQRTSHMLGRFASFFDPLTVFENIPDDWSLDALVDFLTRSLRAATSERNQAMILKALSAAQNLEKQAEFVEACDKNGVRLEAELRDGRDRTDPTADATV